MDIEEEIGELRQLIEENIEVSKDTNHLVRKMRRSAMWSMVMTVVWWLAVAGVTGWSYYYFIEPQIAKVEKLYGITQQDSQNWNEQVTSFLKYFGSQPQASSTQPR